MPTISHFILQSPTPVYLSYGVNAKTYPDGWDGCHVLLDPNWLNHDTFAMLMNTVLLHP